MNSINNIFDQQKNAMKKAVTGAVLVGAFDYFINGGSTNLNVLDIVNVPSYIGLSLVTGGAIYASDTVRTQVLNRVISTSNQNMIVPGEALATGVGLTGFIVLNGMVNGNGFNISNLYIPLLLGAGADVGADYLNRTIL